VNAIGDKMFDWVNYIILANELIKYKNEESIQSAISRLYYGFFGVLRHYLTNVKHKHYLKQKKGNVHKKVFYELYHSDDLTEYELSLLLNKLRSYRNNADYDEEFDKEHFEDFLTENKENIFSAFHSLKSLKNHPNY